MFSLHQVLVSDFAELHEIRLEAVHLLVDLPVVGDLLSQVLLQLTLAVVDLLHTRLQTLRVALDPESTEWQNYKCLKWGRWKKLNLSVSSPCFELILSCFCSWMKPGFLRISSTKKGNLTFVSLFHCPPVGIVPETLCCSAPESHTAPQRSWWSHWRPRWLCVSSAAPVEKRDRLWLSILWFALYHFILSYWYSSMDAYCLTPIFGKLKWVPVLYLWGACVLLIQGVVLAALLLVLLMIYLQLLSHFLYTVLLHQLSRAKCR